MGFLENMLTDICGSDIFDSIIQTLSINLFSDAGQFSNALSIVKRIHTDVVMPVALMLVFLYFMMAVVDKASSENFTWEQLWRQMIMLLVAKFLIDHGFEILELLFEIGMALAAEVSVVSDRWINNPQNTFDAAAMIESFQAGLGLDDWPKFIKNILTTVIMFGYLIFPWLLSWIMRLAVSVICYTRVIEIYVRATFAPVALADFFYQGLQGGGWRYLKNFLAVCFQGALLLLIAVIFSALFSQLVAEDQNLFTFIGSYLAFFASALMLMFKSLSLSKEILGTN